MYIGVLRAGIVVSCTTALFLAVASKVVLKLNKETELLGRKVNNLHTTKKVFHLSEKSKQIALNDIKKACEDYNISHTYDEIMDPEKSWAEQEDKMVDLLDDIQWNYAKQVREKRLNEWRSSLKRHLNYMYRIGYKKANNEDACEDLLCINRELIANMLNGGLKEYDAYIASNSYLEDWEKADLKDIIESCPNRNEKKFIKHLINLAEKVIFLGFGVFSLLAYYKPAIAAFKDGQYIKLGAVTTSSLLVGVGGDFAFRSTGFTSHLLDYESSPPASATIAFATATALSVATGHAVASLF